MSNQGNFGQPPQGGGWGSPPQGAPMGGPPAAPPGGFGPPGQPPMEQDGYEFTHEENTVISECAKWGTVLAVIYFVLAALNICNLCGKPLEASINIATYVLVGIFIILSAGAMKAVVNTQGNDVRHMLDAVEKLGNMFLVRLIAFVISLVFIVIGLAITFTTLSNVPPAP